MRGSKLKAKMVGWFNPPMLVRAGVDTVISTTLGQYADQRLVQALVAGPGIILDYSRGDVREIELTPIDAGPRAAETSPKDSGNRSPLEQADKDFWLDYVADLGDGWGSTYTVAYLLAQPHIDVDGGERHRLAGGRLLVFGGDQVYPVASRHEYQRRLIGPYQAAFANRTGPDVYAIPGNHDWYDGLVYFSSLFCARQPFAEFPGDEIPPRSPGCPTRQRRSYFAIKLPRGWWLLGTDVQLGSDIDAQQVLFFKSVAARMQEGDRVVLCTPEPHWLNPKKEQKREFGSTTALETLERDVLGRRVAVLIAGDIHHYSRYESGDAHLITAGGGGAFLHPTHGPWREEVELDQGLPAPAAVRETRATRTQRAGGKKSFRRKATFPSPRTSWWLGLRNLLFPLLNPTFGVATAALYLIFGLLLIPAESRYYAYRDWQSKDQAPDAERVVAMGTAPQFPPATPATTTPGGETVDPGGLAGRTAPTASDDLRARANPPAR